MDVFEMIRKQQAQHHATPAFYVGEQLADILRGDGADAQAIVAEDLGRESMGIDACEKQIAAYAHDHRQGNCGCCPPGEAERIIRAFYGIERGSGAQAGDVGNAIDLTDFL